MREFLKGIVVGWCFVTLVGALYFGCASGGSTVDVDIDDAAIACGEGDVEQGECVKE